MELGDTGIAMRVSANWKSITTANSAEGCLSDLRVLDFSTLLPGPFCTQILADLGADVITIEPPGGDPCRRVPGDIYTVVNRSKNVMTADLKNASDRAACLRLAKEADVLVEGFRPGVVARLGIGYEDVRYENQRIVYCSISGFGQTGPFRDRPGHDITYLAVSGGLSFSPHWHGTPRRSGIPIGDLAGATFATIAILTALREAERKGIGSYLDVSIADATMACIAPRGGSRLDITNADRYGVYPTNELYETADGELIAVAAVEQKSWQCLRDGLAPYAPIVTEPKFDTPEGRHSEHGDELVRILTNAFRKKRASEWLSILSSRDLCVERVVSLAEAARGSHASARGFVVERDGERHVVFPVIKNGRTMGRWITRDSSDDDTTDVCR